MNETEKIVDQLREDWGISFPLARSVIHGLRKGAAGIDTLVAETGLSRRGVERILGRLSPLLSEDRSEFLPDARADLPQTLDPPAIDEKDALSRIQSILENRPKPNRSLDHVAATPETVLRRAVYLLETFDLSRAGVLLLGDHDLTSIGLATIAPHLDLWVCDIDDRLLSFVDDANTEHGFRIQTVFADLRVELPRSLQDRFHLVFTDPPYTKPGIRLFLQRSVSALANTPNDRILLAYGYGEDQVTLGYKVQSVIHDQRLLLEAVLSGFSAYSGAQAIGSRSSLHVLRPTRRSKAAAKTPEKTLNIYSHGTASEEAEPVDLPARLTGEIDTVVPDLVVGHPVKSAKQSIELGQYIQGKDVQGESGRVLINLFPHHEQYVLRAICRSKAETLLVCANQRALADLFAHDSAARRLVYANYDLGDRIQDGPAALVKLTRRAPQTPDEKIVSEIARRHGAKLGNAFREGLIAASPTDLTKNQARDIVAQTWLGDRPGDLYLSELPRHRLDQLMDEAASALRKIG